MTSVLRTAAPSKITILLSLVRAPFSLPGASSPAFTYWSRVLFFNRFYDFCFFLLYEILLILTVIKLFFCTFFFPRSFKVFCSSHLGFQSTWNGVLGARRNWSLTCPFSLPPTFTNDVPSSNDWTDHLSSVSQSSFCPTSNLHIHVDWLWMLFSLALVICISFH